MTDINNEDLLNDHIEFSYTDGLKGTIDNDLSTSTNKVSLGKKIVLGINNDSIANNKLVNDSITINGVEVSLGGSISSTQIGGAVVQEVFNESRTYTSTTTVIPRDDTVPQITEGVELLSASINPISASNTIIIECGISGTTTAGGVGIMALFVDSGSDAIEASVIHGQDVELWYQGRLLHRRISGTTNSLSFTLRAGPDSGTMYFNGDSGSRVLGGSSSTYIKLTEYRA